MRRILSIGAMFCAIAAATWSTAIAAASPQLVAALQTLRTSGVSSAEHVLANLDERDAGALRFWLSGHGRDALHAAGATDAEIGPPVNPIDYHITWVEAPPTPQPPPPKRKSGFFGGLLAAVVAPLKIPVHSSSSSSTSTQTTPTETGYHTETTTTSSSTSVSVGLNPGALLGMLVDAASSRRAPSEGSHPSPQELLRWHKITLGRFEGTAPDTGGIRVKRGLAAVRNNYADGAACISFVNDGSKAIDRVDFDLTFLDKSGHFLQTVALDRRGSFAPGARVDGPEHEGLIAR